MADYTLSAKATFDGSNFNKGIKSSESSLDGFKKKVSAISVAVGNILANGFGKAMSAVTSSIDSAVRRVDTMNNFPKVMKNLGYSAEDAEAAVSKMSDRLSGLPTTLDSMTSGVQRLVPSVKNVGTATDIMLALNDALLAGGSSIAVQEAAMEQFSQAVSKGKFELEEWRSVQTAMPGQLDQLAKSLMGSEAGAMDLYEAMKAGTIGMDQFLAELVRLDTEGGENFASFQQQALDGTSGIQTGMANAANAVTKGVASIFDAIGGERIAAGFNTIRQAITDTFNGISEQVGLFFSTMDSNEGFQLMQENFGLLQGIFSDIGSAIGIMVGELFGIQEGTEPAVAAADLLKGAMEGVRDVLTGVKDATAWLKENAQQLTPVLVGLVGAFIAFKVISGIAGFITAFSTALTGVAGPVSAAGAASGMSATQILALAAAVIAVGAGVALASAGMLLLSQAAISIAGAGPGAAVAMVAMVAAIAGLAAGAALAGPALTAGAAGMIAFGAAVALVGAGVLAASAGIALVAGQLPTIASSGTSAAAAMIAIAAGATTMAAGLTLAAAGVTLFAAGLTLAAVGVAAFAVAIAAGAIAVTAAAVAFTALGLAVNVLATGITTAADGMTQIGTAMPKIAESAPEAATGMTAFSAAALAASVGLLAATPAVTSYAEAMTTAAPAIVESAAGTTLFGSALMIVASSAPIAASGVTSLGTAMSSAAPLIAEASPSLISAGAAATEAAAGFTVAGAGATVMAAGFTVALAATVTLVAGFTAMAKGIQSSMDASAMSVRNFSSRAQSDFSAFSKTVTMVMVLFATTMTAQGQAGMDGFTSAVSSGIAMALALLTSFGPQAQAAISSVNLYASGKAMLDSLTSGIRAGFSSAISAVQSGMSQLRAYFPFSPAKKGPFSGHGYTTYSGIALMEGFAEGIDKGASEPLEAMKAAGEDISNTAWDYGYHAAVNYAEGLSQGVQFVEESTEELGDAAKDGMSDADAELQAYIDEMIANYRERGDEFAETSTKIAEAIWDGFYPAIDQKAWLKPMTGAVYDSMKILERAGFDTLDDYEERIAQYKEEAEKYQEEAADWEKKKAATNKKGESTWTDSNQDSYDDWLKEYEEWQREYQNFQDMQASLTADIPTMREWGSLYKIKDELISGTSASEQLSQALRGVNLEGVTFSKEFVDYIAEGGEDVVKALQKMAELGPDAVQEFSDSFRDMALAEREAELDARSLYVNSLKYTDFSNQQSMMLDFREVVLDVREAIYSDSGLSGAFEKAGVSAEGFALDLDSVGYSMEDFTSYMDEFTSKVSDGFNQFTKHGAMGLDEWTQNLQLNKAEAQDWANNLTEIFNKLPSEVDSQAFREAVLAGGMEEWGQVIDDMASMSAEQIAEVVELYNSAMEEGQLASIEAFRALAPGEEFVSAVIEGVEASQGLLDQSMTDASTQANQTMMTTAPEWFTTGSSLAGGIAAGIQSQIGAIASAAAETVRAAIAAAQAEAAIASPSHVMRDEVGVMMSRGLAVGIEKAGGQAVTAMEGVMGSTMAAADFVVAGGYSVPNRASGMQPKQAGTTNTYGGDTWNVYVRDDRDIEELQRSMNRNNNRKMRASAV